MVFCEIRPSPTEEAEVYAAGGLMDEIKIVDVSTG